MIQIQEKILTLGNCKISVLGAGISGIYAATLAGMQGADVLLSDAATPNLTAVQKDLLKKYQVNLETEGHSEKIFDAHFVVKSPGIPNSSNIIKELKAKSIPVIGEIEFAYQLLNTNHIIAVTGSNGKTTTTTMIAEFLKNSGRPVFCGGNIGNPLSKIVLTETIDDTAIIVLELSSFQLEDIHSFRPSVSLFLNITEDHMDRYDHDPERYFQAKNKITKNQFPDDHYIYYAHDKKLSENLPQKVNCIPFFPENQNSGIFIKDQTIFYNAKKLVSLQNLNICGEHNYLNLLAALQVCQLYNLTKQNIYESVKNFMPPEHRLEFVVEIDGVKYYNDSKATNVDSVKMALTAFNEPVVLILGGRDKAADFRVLSSAIQQKVRHLIITGEAGEKIHNQLKNVTATTVIKDFRKAVEQAGQLAQKGDVVLLSPACASFDAFRNFEERGKFFKKIVKGMQ